MTEKTYAVAIAPRKDSRTWSQEEIRFSELVDWAAKLEALGITHGGVVDAPYGSGLSFRDPDGIALEFFAPPE